MEKKLLTTILLSLIIVSGCKRNKKLIVPANPPILENGIIVEKIDRLKENEKTNEEADDLPLEDNAPFNVFEDEEVKQVENNKDEDNFTWEDDEDDNEFETVQFDYDSAEIKPSEKQKIANNAQNLKKHLAENNTAKVILKGHSCKIANNKEYNYVLSQERAQKVGYEYERQGISYEHIKPVGYGSSLLLTDEDGMDEQAKNRRVETELVK